METVALYTIGCLCGIKTASILNTVVEYTGNLEDEINHYTDDESMVLNGERNEINVALNAIIYCNNNNIKLSILKYS